MTTAPSYCPLQMFRGTGIIEKFKDVSLDLDRCLNALPLVNLKVSEEIRGQVGPASLVRICNLLFLQAVLKVGWFICAPDPQQPATLNTIST